MIGLRLAQYRIDAELGRGGMGIVYRATDTKLDRTVALKVLPVSAVGSAEDRARFFREAKAAAQLSHPNVCHVYQVDDAVPHAEGKEPQPGAEPRLFIAMEYIEGETLAAVITRGPMKLADAVGIASQVAEALRAAHAKDIVHRDIKSANVMLTAEGMVKVFDFGLAKTNASTQLTRQGSTLGTVAYMSPEQARGQEVDGRSDLYSLGTVLYEMVAGRLPYAGDYEQAILYGILNEDPTPLTALRTGVAMDLEAVVFKLLRKEARLRYQTAADLIADLHTIAIATRSGIQGASSRSVVMSGSRSEVDPPSSGSGGRPAHRIETAPAERWRRYALWFGFVGLLFGALATAAVLRSGSAGRAGAPVADVVRSTLMLPPEHPMLVSFSGLAMEISGLDLTSDGRMLVYVGLDGEDRKLILRDMTDGSIRVLDGTLEASNPSFSPDGSEIAYLSESGIYRVPTEGGRSTFVTSFADGAGLDWAPDGYIYGADYQGSELFRINENGERVSIMPGRRCNCALPTRAPGDYGIVMSGRDHEQVFRVGDDGTVDTTEVQGNHVRFLSAGYVMYARTGSLIARRWDMHTGILGPVESRVLDDVRTGSIARSAHYAVSDAGTLVYLAGEPSGVVKLVIREADGTDVELGAPEGIYGPVDVSPDGRRVVVTSYDTGGRQLIIDVDTGRQQFVDGTGGAIRAIWSADGAELLVQTETSGGTQIERLRPDRVGAGDIVLRSAGRITPSAVSPDGKWLAYEALADVGYGLRLRNLADSTEWEIPDLTSQSVWGADFSRDNRYLAYTRVGGDGSRVYVATVPPTDNEWLVSSGGGEEPEWLPDEDALVYRNDRDWMIVEVRSGTDGPILSEPRLLFSGPYINVAGVEYRMLSGRRAVLQRPINTAQTADRLEVVTGWFTHLDRVLK